VGSPADVLHSPGKVEPVADRAVNCHRPVLARLVSGQSVTVDPLQQGVDDVAPAVDPARGQDHGDELLPVLKRPLQVEFDVGPHRPVLVDVVDPLDWAGRLDRQLIPGKSLVGRRGGTTVAAVGRCRAHGYSHSGRVDHGDVTGIAARRPLGGPENPLPYFGSPIRSRPLPTVANQPSAD